MAGSCAERRYNICSKSINLVRREGMSIYNKERRIVERICGEYGGHVTRVSHVLFYLSQDTTEKPKHHLNQECHLRIDP